MGKEITLVLVRLALTFSVAAQLICSNSTAAASLLNNPGFESDPGGHSHTLYGWQSYGTNYFNETSAASAHGGTNYFKVYQTFSSSVNYNGIYQDYISAPGAVYSADGWAYTASSDAIGGHNVAWLEVTFRDAVGNMLALYRSSLITSNALTFAKDKWSNLAVTNQYDPGNFQVTNTAAQITAPAGTVYLRYQIVFQGDANNSGGSVYFDDLNLVQTGGTPYGNMNIVWSDEFDGSAIKTNIWTYDLGAGGWGNNELEFYTNRTSNAFVTNGTLHIVARKESIGNSSYSSARMKSQGLFACKYGRIEWRAQLPQGVGCWPALWLLGTNITSIGWPGCGEIDAVENIGSNPLMVQGSLHSGSDETAIYYFTNGAAVTGFHTYTLDWTTNAFLFYVDGHLYQTQTGWSSSTGTYPYPFNQPFFLLMNLAIGGNYISNPSQAAINAGTVFPSELVVDYVRIYKPTEPFRLAVKQAGSNLVFSWPSNIVCRIQAQTNALAQGLGTNWFSVGAATNQLQITPGGGSGFYRLASP